MEHKPGTLLLRIETSPWKADCGCAVEYSPVTFDKKGSSQGGEVASICPECNNTGTILKRLEGWIIPHSSYLADKPNAREWKAEGKAWDTMLGTESGVRVAMAIEEVTSQYIISYMENIKLAHLGESLPAHFYKSESNPLGLEEVTFQRSEYQ